MSQIWSCSPFNNSDTDSVLSDLVSGNCKNAEAKALGGVNAGDLCRWTVENELTLAHLQTCKCGENFNRRNDNLSPVLGQVLSNLCLALLYCLFSLLSGTLAMNSLHWGYLPKSNKFTDINK